MSRRSSRLVHIHLIGAYIWIFKKHIGLCFNKMTNGSCVSCFVRK